MRRWCAMVAVLGCTLAVGSACGSDDSGDTGTDKAKIVNITFDGDSVSPSGERVEVKAGQPIDLVVKADEPGEIHVHADVEQTLEYAAGTTTLKLQIDRPGVVEVESHDLDMQIVSLEVR